LVIVGGENVRRFYIFPSIGAGLSVFTSPL
jgi:hypothetical protein